MHWLIDTSPWLFVVLWSVLVALHVGAWVLYLRHEDPNTLATEPGVAPRLARGLAIASSITPLLTFPLMLPVFLAIAGGPGWLPLLAIDLPLLWLTTIAVGNALSLWLAAVTLPLRGRSIRLLLVRIAVLPTAWIGYFAVAVTSP